MKLFARFAALVTLVTGLLMQPVAAHASDAPWTGTWTSNHGELRLIQEGNRVYGDYAKRGWFEGRISDDGQRLRGTFQYRNSETRSGYIEFFHQDGAFTGAWSWGYYGTVTQGKNAWRGQRVSSARPQLRYAVGNDDYWASFWDTAPEADRAWVGGGSVPGSQPDYANQPEYAGLDTWGDVWSGTFTTNYGDLRLTQIGRRVFGDYANRGYFEGCTHDDGTTLRGTFQYNSPRRNHGFIEFRMDGDGFEGTWTWTGSGVPQPGARVNWRGARSAAAAPSLLYVDGSRPHFADNWQAISDAEREWVLGSQYYDSCDPPEVDYAQ